MNDKRNVVVMFLLIMLSFAIISEVSAVSDAEADGTGLSLSVKSDDDIDGERFADGMQRHDDFKSHNEQKSFNHTPNDFGDNHRNENLYEHKMNEMPAGDRPSDNGTGFDKFKPMADGADFDMFKPDGNGTGFDGMVNHDSNRSFEMKDKFKEPKDLRDNRSVHVQNGELMDDVVSKLIGMNNIGPDFKSNQKFPSNNKDKSAPDGADKKNSSKKLKNDINKTPKKVKTPKKTSKKVKINKKAKKPSKKLAKKSKKERAKL